MSSRERFLASALALEDAHADQGDSPAANRSFVFACKRWLMSEGWTLPTEHITSPEAVSLRDRALAVARLYADSDSEDDTRYAANLELLEHVVQLWLRAEGWSAPITYVRQAA